MSNSYRRVEALKAIEVVLMNSKLFEDSWDNEVIYKEGQLFDDDHYNKLWSVAFAKDYFRDFKEIVQVVTNGEDILGALGDYVLGEKATTFFFDEHWDKAHQDNYKEWQKIMRKHNPFNLGEEQ